MKHLTFISTLVISGFCLSSEVESSNQADKFLKELSDIVISCDNSSKDFSNKITKLLADSGANDGSEKINESLNNMYLQQYNEQYNMCIQIAIIKLQETIKK